MERELERTQTINRKLFSDYMEQYA